jgi:putative spermidine/putrescine transport system permease protein
MRFTFWGTLRIVVSGLTLVYTLAPLVVITILSFSSAPFLTFPPPGFSLIWYRKILSDPDWSSSLLTTVMVTIPAAMIATAIGTGAAIAVVRGRIPAPTIVGGVIMLPLVIPAIIAAAALSAAFGRIGLLGTYVGFLVAHVLLTIPYVFSVTQAALKTVSGDVEGAALTLGAGPRRVLFRITLPMILPSVISGFLFAAVVSFSELVVSMFLSSPNLRTVSVQMWSNVRGSVDPTIAAVATSIFLLTVAILVIEHCVRRRSE